MIIGAHIKTNTGNEPQARNLKVKTSVQNYSGVTIILHLVVYYNVEHAC